MRVVEVPTEQWFETEYAVESSLSGKYLFTAHTPAGRIRCYLWM